MHIVENSHCGELPGFLSCFQEKRHCYSRDPHFLSGWGTINRLSENDRFQIGKLWDLGSILFKADSTLAGNFERGLAFVRQRGLSIRAARIVSMNSATTAEFWEYSLGRLSRERIELLARLQSLCGSFYLIVERREKESALPCALEVTEMKGQVKLNKRRRNTLRYALGPPHSAFFNFVHTADEPADLVRELGVLFDETERDSLLQEVSQMREIDPGGLYDRLRKNVPNSDFDFESALCRVRKHIQQTPQITNVVKDELLKMAGTESLTDFDSWCALNSNLLTYGVRISEIDGLTIEGELVPLQKKHKVQPFPSCEAVHWQGYQPPRPADPQCRSSDGTG